MLTCYTRVHEFTLILIYCMKIITQMSEKNTIQRIKENAVIAKQTIDELKNELNIINKEYNIMLTKQLQEENAKLVAAVEDAKKKLIQLEIQNGIQQIPVPNCISDSVAVEEPAQNVSELVKEVKEQKPKKETNKKEVKEVSAELPVDIGRLDLRIGKIVDATRHPDADSLYVLQINCGEEKPRTVCSGLVKYMPVEDLHDKNVVLLCNLKPVKMRGITSEAMVMCACSETGVEVLSPPKDSVPGDLVHCDGYTRQPDVIMNPKKKIFETVAPHLHTNENLQACYKNIPWNVPGKGFCIAKSMKNVLVR